MRKSVARVLTIINQNNRSNVIQNIRKRVRDQPEGEGVKKVESIVKNLKRSHIPVDLRPKRTRAIRRRLTKQQASLVQLRVLKRRLNFPTRKFAVPA